MNSNQTQGGGGSMSDVILFPKASRRMNEILMSHIGDCDCEECCSKRRLLSTLKNLAPASSENPPPVAKYEDSLMRGLETWLENPSGSMFDAVTEQLVTDGIIRT